MSEMLKRELKDKIVDAARDLFLEHGIEKTSMEDVAAAVGVSKPKIYDLFENKSALLFAVVDSTVQDFDLSLSIAAMRGEISFGDYLDRMPDECYAAITDKKRSAMNRILIREGTRSRELAAAIIVHLGQKVFGVYEDLFRNAIARGECRVIDPSVAKRLILAPTNTLIQQIVIGGEDSLPAHIKKEFLQHYFAMMKSYLLVK